MTNLSMISVIIPTFNRATFLREAIDSVLAQTEQDFELIVVDDGSTDQTRELIAEYGGRVRYLYQSNRGVSAARNLGIRHATGKLIAFLDSDDLWLPKKLARQVKWLAAHPSTMLCHTDEIWIRRGVRVNQKKIHAKSGGWIYPMCLPRCIISPSSVVMRRELFDVVGVFDEQLPVCEDYDLWLRVTPRLEVGFIPEPLIIKRGGHSDQLSHREWGNDRYRVMALIKIYESGILDEFARQLTAEMIVTKCTILENGFWKRQKAGEAMYYKALKERFHKLLIDAREAGIVNNVVCAEEI
ncbi:MAG: glycosyltransferase [candidate division KSB1 bacterium]|nr:glycosyltransferase [candidate division KSB1 bacterium]MDZ7300633.1 glycosyltransferase [candidate division KSB1 bacterium]MDZ7309770.1 glycosyltransferase [candidate division KSB1 bacterium]